MNSLLSKANHKLATGKSIKEAFRNEAAAIDLASIMVGIIVIGLVGGVIAATVFAVIPWTQDNAAKHQLESIVAAESAYIGLGSDSPPALPSGHQANSFGNSAALASASLLSTGKTYCAVTTDGGKSYQGFSQSSSGKVWTVSNESSKPEIFKTETHGELPTDCNFITVGFDNEQGTETPSEPVEEEPYVDPTPTRTTLTYKCDTKVTNGQLPFSSISNSYAWNDGTNPTLSRNKTLEAGKEYTVVTEGTYGTFQATTAEQIALSGCLRSVDHWGANTGVTNANYAFNGAVNLINVPENIPTTITNASFMFKDASSFNDPDIAKWNTSKVINMGSMFIGATSLNQSLNSWDVSKVINMQSMFNTATSFNQPLNNWNVSNVTDMIKMFEGANAFNQDLSAWDTSSVVKMALMFGDPFAMKNGVKHNTFDTTTTLTYKCDTKVTSGQLPMSSMSYAWNDGTNPTLSRAKTLEAGIEYTVVVEGTYGTFQAVAAGETLLSGCLRSVDHWGVNTGVMNVNYAFNGAVNLINVPENIPTTITNASFMFKDASSFNDPDIAKWNTSKVINMGSMFIGATSLNQSLNSWDVSKVINMQSMFNTATSFNQPLNNWDVSNVTDMIKMFEGANAFNNDLSAWDTSSVVKMALMFGDPFAMKHGVKHNTFDTTTTLTYKCDTKVTSGQLPISSSISHAWNDGTTPTLSRAKTLEAGIEYTVVVEGTYGTFQAVAAGETLLSGCLRSVDHWGVNTGVTSAAYAFNGAVNLTNVPENIPTTITNASFMFKNASSFNDPDIAKWNTSKVMNMTSMFNGATSFNQNLSGWNTTALTSGTTFAPASFPDAFMPVGTSK